jgi:hypothetical protein
VELSALATLAGISVLLWAMIAYETAGYREERYLTRHPAAAEPPSS